ncbi:hypothetical protein MASR1M97_04370 [Candidatus Desulfobacillus denitrificans]
MTNAALPTDIDALRAMVLAQQAQIEHLKLVIAKLRRMQFGRRSEQLGQTIDQLELALEELETAKAQSAAPAVAAEPAEANKPARNPCRHTCRARRSCWPRRTPAVRTAAVP